MMKTSTLAVEFRGLERRLIRYGVCYRDMMNSGSALDL